MHSQLGLTRKLQFVERLSCPVCSGQGWQPVFSSRYSAGLTARFIQRFYGLTQDHFDPSASFLVSRCNQCDLLFHQQVLDAKSLETLYEDIISKEDSLRKKVEAPRALFDSYLNQTALIGKFFPQSLPHTVRILDFGMGWGHWALAAQARGHEAWGSELSPSRIRFARERGVRVANLSDDKFVESFDFVNLDQVLEHVVDLDEVVQLVSNVTARGGIAHVSVPKVSRSYLVGRRNLVEKGPLQPLEHVNGFRKKSMDLLMRRFGFKALKLRDLPFPANRTAVRQWLERHFLGAASWYYKKEN